MYVGMQVGMYLYICMSVCLLSACLHVCCLSVCMHACMYSCMHVYVCVCACVYVCMCACGHLCICACLHVCLYACMHGWMYGQDVKMHAHAKMHGAKKPRFTSWEDMMPCLVLEGVILRHYLVDVSPFCPSKYCLVSRYPIMGRAIYRSLIRDSKQME